MLRLSICLLVLFFSFIGGFSPAADIPFLRGDANVDGRVNIADGIWLLQHLYLGGPGGDCAAARDTNADGVVDLADAAHIISFRLMDGGPPRHPYPYCGISSVGDCDSYPVCPEVPEVTVTRDDRGVWFIEGGDLYGLYEAFGYAVATDRLWQAEFFRRLCRGRLTEILGPSQLNTDIAIRLVGYSEQELEDGFSQASEVGQHVALAYLDGFNRRIDDVIADTDLLPYEFSELDLMPDHWTITDMMALQVTLLRNFDSEALATHQLDNALLLAELLDEHPIDGMEMFDDLRWLDDPEAPTMIPPEDFSIPFAATDAPPVPQPGQYQIENLRALRDRVDDVFAGTTRRLAQLGTTVRMGSYAWVVSGDLTETGNPTLYSGPQMGFNAPGLIVEGSLKGAGVEVSGMALAGLPGMIIGRSPRHAWSGQVAHAHTVDIYLDDAEDIFLHRVEYIPLNSTGAVMTLPIYRTEHGPVVAPLILNPDTVEGPVATWKYSHWQKELQTVDVNLDYVMARNIDDFADAMDRFCVSLHVCYADRRGNVGYWMAGLDPVRPPDADPRLPQLGDGTMEWTNPVTYKPRKTVRNPQRGWMGGWNNKAGGGSAGGASPRHSYGRYHRAHAVQDRLAQAAAEGPLSFEFIRDLALEISATDCCDLGESGGNRWFFVEDAFVSAVESDPNLDRLDALTLLDGWDGYFPAGGPDAWTTGELDSDAWLLQDRWISKVVELTFEDELDTQTLSHDNQSRNLLFNVLIRALPGSNSVLEKRIDWFQNRGSTPKPTDATGIIVLALDDTLAELGPRPWDHPRATIDYEGPVIGQVWSSPWLDRSTYAQVVEVGPEGPVRIESMIPLGESGAIYQGPGGEPEFDEQYFGFTDIFDGFLHRPFPTFDENP